MNGFQQHHCTDSTTGAAMDCNQGQHSAAHHPHTEELPRHHYSGESSLQYLFTIAVELNNVGVEMHASLGHTDHGEHREEGDLTTGLYKEALATVMEAIDGGCEAAQTQRLEMIVGAKERILEAQSRQESEARGDKDVKLRESMFFDPDSVCDGGPKCLMGTIKAEQVGDTMPSREDANGVGSITLQNIGLLQLRRSQLECDDDLLDSAMRFFRMSLDASETLDAAAAATTAVAPSSSFGGEVSTIGRARVQALNNLGHGLFLQGRYEEALDCFLRALARVQGVSGRPLQGASNLPSSLRREDAVVDLSEIMQVSLAHMSGASSHPDSAAAGAAATGGSSSWESTARIFLLCNIGRTHFANFDVHGAARACEKALELCLQQNGREISTISVALLYNLGLIYEEQGVPDKALKCYRQFIDRAPETATSEIVMALTRVLLVECRQIQSSNSSSDMDEVVDVLRHLQQVQNDMGHDHPALASVLRSVSSALTERNEHKYALPFCLESLRIERAIREVNEAAGGTLGADIVVALNAVGECYHSLERLEQAAQFYDEARKIRRRHLRSMIAAAAAGNNQPPSSVRFIFAVTMYNGGRLHFEMGQKETSDAFFDDALDLVSRIACPAGVGHSHDGEANHRCLAECGALQHNIGQYKLEMGHTSDAMRCFQDALRTRRSVLPENHPAVAETLYQLGGLHHRMGDADRALRAFEEKLRIDHVIHGPGHSGGALTMYNMAQIRYDACELERALGMFEHVLAIVSIDPCPSEAQLSPSNLHGWIGTVQGEMGLVEEARASFAESLRTSMTGMVGGGAIFNLADTAMFVSTFVELADLRHAAAA